MVSEVATVAKRDLLPGEIVGEIGSADIFGRTYLYSEAHAAKAIPLGLATGGKVLQPVSKGALLTEDSFAPDPNLFVYKLRRMQDAQLAQEASWTA